MREYEAGERGRLIEDYEAQIEAMEKHIAELEAELESLQNGNAKLELSEDDRTQPSSSQ